MLRRLKAEVEKSLPPKTETILYVGELYTYTYIHVPSWGGGTGAGGEQKRFLGLTREGSGKC